MLLHVCERYGAETVKPTRGKVQGASVRERIKGPRTVTIDPRFSESTSPLPLPGAETKSEEAFLRRSIAPMTAWRPARELPSSAHERSASWLARASATDGLQPLAALDRTGAFDPLLSLDRWPWTTAM